VLFSRTEGNVYTPALSPDGRRVAFTFNLRGMQDVYVADLDVLVGKSVALPAPDAPVSDVNADEARPVLGPDPFGEYFPSFMDAGTVLFSSDRSGSLVLYATDLATGAVTRVRDDPVAAISGVTLGDTLAYASYAGTGYCIKTVPLAELASSPLDLSENSAEPYPDKTEWTGTSVASRPWIDLPAPTLWLPQVTAVPSGASSFDIGFGAMAVGRSLLGASSWSVGGAWLVGSSQPSLSASISADWGPVSIGAEASLDYAYAGAWIDRASASLTAAWTVFNEASLDWAQGLFLIAGARYSSALYSSGSFTLAGALSAPSEYWYSTVSVPLALQYQWYRSGSRLDFTPLLGIDAWIQGTTFLPALSLTAPEEVINLFSALSIPSPIPHQSFKLGMKVEQDISAARATWYDAFTLPRGFPETRSRALPGGMLASIDYVAPIALLDQPLLLGFALTGAGISLHAESLADFSASAFTALPVVFLGGDITLRFAFNGYGFPVGIGIAAALDTANPSSFAPAANLRVYLFSGFDSFGGQSLSPLSAAPGTPAERALHAPAGAWYNGDDAR
jgi:hypothetical protein